MLLLLTAAVAGIGAGWWYREHHLNVRSPLSDVPPLEYFASNGTFSEVDQARSHLRALVRRQIYWIQIRQAALPAERVRQPGPGADAPEDPAAPLMAAFEALQTEWLGTAEESEVVQALLLLLQARGEHRRWVNAYLDFLYRHPTDILVGRLAETALKNGQLAGSVDGVLAGLRVVGQIPLESPARTAARQALAGAGLLCTRPACEAASPLRPTG